MTDLGNPALPDPFVIYLWGPTGPVMEFDAGQVSHAKMLCFDPQGSCVKATCDQYLPFEDRLVKNPMFYDGYGEPVWPDPPSDNQRAMRQPLQYKGQAGYYTDVHTDLCYCINRYYDPRSGRWIMRDPIGLDGGVNVYAYCGGNPVMFLDPFGTDGFMDTICGFGDGIAGFITHPARRWIGNALGIGDANEQINFNSTAYRVSNGVGVAYSMVLPMPKFGALGKIGALTSKGSAAMKAACIAKLGPVGEKLADTRLAGMAYKELTKVLKLAKSQGIAMEAHHLVQKRFAGILGVKECEMASIALTRCRAHNV